MIFKNNKTEKGFTTFYLTILVLAAALVAAAGIFTITFQEQKVIRNITKSNQAYFAAEAGLEDATLRIVKSMDVPSKYTLAVGGESADVQIISPNPSARMVQSTGTASNIFRKIESHLNIETVNPSFFYGAQAGDLGIIMENNSRIEGAGGAVGNVYSNGPISGDNNAVITGNVFVATGMAEDQSHVVYNSDQIFGKNSPVVDIAQSFVPSISDTLVKVSVYIKKVGDPDDLIVRILTDSIDSPTKTTLASGELDEDLVGTSFGWVDIVFSSPPNLTQGVVYWLMIDASADNNDYWVWGKDQDQGYGLGQAKYSANWNAGSPVWTAIAGDLNFKTYMGGQETFLDGVTVLGDAHSNVITESNICGSAFYQTIDSSSFNFLNDPSNPTCPDPLTPGAAFPGSSDPPLQNMPISDSNINQWKEEAALGGVYTGNLTVSSSMSYGPKKIDGNLIMTSNNKVLTVTGTIYVTGYLDIDNGSTIQCSADYGLNSCVVVVDKWVHIGNNGIFRGSGQSGSYLMILSNSSCDGSSSADCTHHNSAMDLHNGATGAIFYANNGLIHLHNGVEVSELTAKKIQLEQGAVIRYEQGLVNAGFSSGPGGSWEVTTWKEVQ